MSGSIQVRLIPMDPGNEDSGFFLDCTACQASGAERTAIGMADDRVEGDQMALEHMASHGVDITPWLPQG